MSKGTGRLLKNVKQFADVQYKVFTARYGQQLIDIFEFPIKLVLSPFTLAYDVVGSAPRGFGVPEFLSKLSASAIFVCSCNLVLMLLRYKLVIRSSVTIDGAANTKLGCYWLNSHYSFVKLVVVFCYKLISVCKMSAPIRYLLIFISSFIVKCILYMLSCQWVIYFSVSEKVKVSLSIYEVCSSCLHLTEVMRFPFSILWLQVVATLGTYDIALEMGKKVLCQRWIQLL